MSSPDLVNLGAGGAFVYLVLREVFAFLKHRQPNGLDKKVENIVELTEDLHKWHDKEDADGVKVWYVRASLERSIEELNETIERQTRVLEKLLDRLDSDKPY